jgi:hypothetical protein
MNETVALQPSSPGILSSLLRSNKWLFFLLWILANVLVVYMNRNYLFTDSIYYNSYGEKVALERIDSFLTLREKFKWLAYVFIPIVLLFKVMLITLALNTGTLLADVKVGFRKLLGMVVVFEGVFILANLVRVLWLAFVVDANHMSQVEYFHPLSLLNMFDGATLPKWLIYPTHLVNFFEAAYIALLAAGMRLYSGQSYGKALALVLSSYGIGLLIWATLISLLSISLS